MKYFDDEKPKRFNTYTKKWISRILTVALIDIQFPFVLAFLGRDQIAETLAGLIVTEIIAVTLGYMSKAFFETKESEKNKVTMEQLLAGQCPPEREETNE